MLNPFMRLILPILMLSARLFRRYLCIYLGPVSKLIRARLPEDVNLFFAFSGLPFAFRGFSSESWYYSSGARTGLDLDLVHGLKGGRAEGLGSK